MNNFDMQTICLISPAKINLFLHITGKRADGYHDLQSVFRAINFGDELSFMLCDGNELLQLHGANHLTDTLDDNLIAKAVYTLAKHYPNHAKSVRITLKKHIPTGAGLGGGSSNCASTLIAINLLWQLNLSTQQLIGIAATLGADVPFFIFAHTHRSDAIATGIGERLSSIDLPKRHYLLLMPNAHLATAHFFKHPNLKKNTHLIHDLQQQYAAFDAKLTPPFHNCFEHIASTDSPPVKIALNYLDALPSTSTPRMTGTGSAVFLPLADDDLVHAERWRDSAPCRAVICSSLYGS